jgi:hypothetical protein
MVVSSNCSTPAVQSTTLLAINLPAASRTPKKLRSLSERPMMTGNPASRAANVTACSTTESETLKCRSSRGALLRMENVAEIAARDSRFGFLYR